MKYICIDIGGTDIKYALADEAGTLENINLQPTEALAKGGAGIVAKVLAIVESLKENREIAGVAISTAGMVDPEAGKIIYALPSSIPDYTGTNLKAIVEEKFNLPCTVENDVNCAALGELWIGSGANATTMFCITVGTSIGGCAVHKGEVIPGASYSAGEVAYMKIPQGQLHDLASTRRLVKEVAAKKNRDHHNLRGEEIFALAKAGDEEVIVAIQNLVEDLADGLTNIIAVLNPHVIVLGGGIMKQEAYLRPLIEKALQERLVPQVYEKTSIEFARLGNNAGMVGALYNFLRRNRG